MFYLSFLLLWATVHEYASCVSNRTGSISTLNFIKCHQACVLPCTDSYSMTYSFPHCSYSTYNVNEDKMAYMKYDGGSVSTFCDQMSFRGRDDGHLNEYKLCISPVYFEDPDCAMTLEFKENYYAAFAMKTFSCNNRPTTEFCTGDDKNAEFELKIDSKKSNSNARFKFKIKAEMTYNYGAVVGGIVGGVCGGIALICAVVGIIVCITCRRKRSAGTVRGPAGTVPMVQYNTAMGYPQTITGSYPQQGTTGYAQYPSPGAYPSTQSQQPVTNTAAPPPSYEGVTSEKF